MGEKRAQRYEVAMSAIRITRELVGVENGMAASRILEAMRSQNQSVTTKPATVRNVLADLKEDYDWGGKIRSLEKERGENTYNYKYYFEPYVSQEELQWIIDDIRTSRLHSPETGERLVEGVKKLLPESMGRKTGAAKVFVSRDALIWNHTICWSWLAANAVCWFPAVK